jgi:trk system potassium uptake protein TrkA
MKKFVAIGLGNFGVSLARTLVESGCEVLGIDSSRETVNRAKDFLSHAVIGDASSREVLEALSIRDYDGAIVSIGQEMTASILITLYLKEIGVQNIIVRAISEDHVKVLSMIGVSEVVFPVKDMAERLASKLAMKNVVDYLPIGADYGIVEVSPPKSFFGRTLRELQIPGKYRCQVIGLKMKEGGKDDFYRIPPAADDAISECTMMIIIGRHNDIDKIQSLP